MKTLKQFIGILSIIAFVFAFTTCDLFGDNDNNENNNNGNDIPIIIVEPMIKTKWNQNAPFNNFVPMDGDSRSNVGCVAVAMAQIMKYHRYPEQGIGQGDSYTTSTGINVPIVNFEVIHNWDNMLDTYPSATSGTLQEQNSVATIMYHAGVSVLMNYSASGSEPSINTAPPLINFFGYDKNIEYHIRNYYKNDAEWEAIIREQLDSGLPIIVSGGNHLGGGHRFIIDGYDNKGRFHINYGWGGNHDGWYTLDNMTYNRNQRIWINIKPCNGGIGTSVIALESLTVDKSIVQKNESFVLSVRLIGVGYFLGGQIGAVLVDNNGNIAEIMVRSTPFDELNVGTTRGSTITCRVNEAPPGQYQIKIVIKPTGGEWKVATLSIADNLYITVQ